jgi:signal transduction histidine kinase
VAVIAPVVGAASKDSPTKENSSALHGLPFTRSYPLEEIGNVPRGGTLSFDRFGRLAVVQDGFYSVLDDTTWLDLSDRTSGDESMPYIFQSDDNRAYYGSFGSWGIVEHTADGRLRPHSLRSPNPPKWVQTTGFTDIALTTRGVFFGGWSGVVYWDLATRKNQFFEVFGFSKLFLCGDDVYVSTLGGPLQRIDVVSNRLVTVEGTNLDEDSVAQTTSLNDSLTLVSTRKGSIFVFDGSHLVPWAGQQRNNLDGRITALKHLLEGGVAIAIAGKGLYLVSDDGAMISALTSSEFHRIMQLATHEPGVLWARGEDALQKVLYGSALTVFGQRLGLNPSWPTVLRWNDKIVVVSGGLMFEAIPAAAGSATRFELMKNQPSAGAWTVAASATHLLVGNDKGAFAEESDGSYTPVLRDMDVARLTMVGPNLCFAIGRVQIAALRLTDGKWTECAPRIPSFGFPSVVHIAKKSVWVELGANRVARLSLEKGQIRSLVLDNFPWKERHWINVGIIDDTVVLTGPIGGRIFYNENTQAFCAAPELERLLDQSPKWILRVQKDETGILWATHDEGVVAFVPHGGGYEMDTTTFDLNNEHFPVVQLLPGNDIWLTTGESLYHVDKQKAFTTTGSARALRRSQPILVSVTDGRTNAELVTDTGLSNAPLQLPYSSNNLSFRFFAGGYGWRRTPVYEFRFGGGQTEWTSLGTGSLLSFPGLHEGSYHLSVRIANTQGPISPEMSLQFEILPPWHRTRPAYALYILGGALAVYGLTRWSVRRAHDRNLTLEGIVRERTDQLKTTMQKLNEGTRNAATLAERGRLAGEIHDSVQQGLSGLMLQLDATLKLPAITGDVRSRLNVARNMISFTREEVQHAVWDMESPLLENTELDEALRKIAALIGSGAAKIEISVLGPTVALPSATQHHLLRIAQEAITNAVRHAGPTTITVLLEYRTDTVFLCIADKGKGFAPDDVLEKSVGHFGLRGLRGRVAKIEGELWIESSPGQGTTIEVVTPFTERVKPLTDAVSNTA